MVFVKAKAFQITKGREKITSYKAEPPYQYDRCFCSGCGTALGEVFSEESSFPVSANCFDGDLELEIGFHEFVSEKPAWLIIGDKAKQFEEHPTES